MHTHTGTAGVTELLFSNIIAFCARLCASTAQHSTAHYSTAQQESDVIKVYAGMT